MSCVIIVALLLAWYSIIQARANPPEGQQASPEVGAWYHALVDNNGALCCSLADCRRTASEMRDDGQVWAWIGKAQFGDNAPDNWVQVPTNEVKIRGNRPLAVRGVVVCYYNGHVACYDGDGGL